MSRRADTEDTIRVLDGWPDPGSSPSVRAIARIHVASGLTCSVKTAANHLDELERDGMIERGPHAPRRTPLWTLTDAGRRWIAPETEEERAALTARGEEAARRALEDMLG